MAWHSHFTKPEQFQLQNVGASSWEEFLGHGERMTREIRQELLSLLGGFNSDQRVLDFGCGIGRIALKLWHDQKLPTHGCDINPEAISYLGEQLKDGPELIVTEYTPPLPYPDNFFDAIFSISIWTHLPLSLQLPWLEEMHRIIKPGGCALISISSAESLPIRKKRLPMWEPYSEEDLEREGILFVEYRYLEKTPEAYPGVTESYGSALHDFNHVKETWGQVFSSVEIKPKAVHNSQDLVVLKK